MSEDWNEKRWVIFDWEIKDPDLICASYTSDMLPICFDLENRMKKESGQSNKEKVGFFLQIIILESIHFPMGSIAWYNIRPICVCVCVCVCVCKTLWNMLSLYFNYCSHWLFELCLTMTYIVWMVLYCVNGPWPTTQQNTPCQKC
jgi:hypothetical protein